MIFPWKLPFPGDFHLPTFDYQRVYIYVIYVHMQGYVLSSLMVSRFSQDWKQWNCRCLAWQCPPPGWCGDWTTSIAPQKKIFATKIVLLKGMENNLPIRFYLLGVSIFRYPKCYPHLGKPRWIGSIHTKPGWSQGRRPPEAREATNQRSQGSKPCKSWMILLSPRNGGDTVPFGSILLFNVANWKITSLILGRIMIFIIYTWAMASKANS